MSLGVRRHSTGSWVVGAREHMAQAMYVAGRELNSVGNECAQWTVVL